MPGQKYWDANLCDRRAEKLFDWESADCNVWPLPESFQKDDAGNWAIEVTSDPVVSLISPCHGHREGSRGHDFRRLVGLTTCSRVKEIRPYGNRDHLAGCRKIDIDDWVFQYNVVAEVLRRANNLNDVWVKGAKGLIESFIKRGLPIIPVDIARLWYSILNQMKTMLIAERARWEDE